MEYKSPQDYAKKITKPKNMDYIVIWKKHISLGSC